MKNISGIYKITNNVNGKFYIGSSQNISRRWYDHKRELRIQKHHNKYLQRAWNKYGEENFSFEISMLYSVILTTVAGGIGGIIGVNF